MLADHQTLTHTRLHPPPSPEPLTHEPAGFHMHLYGALDAPVSNRLRHTIRLKFSQDTPPTQLTLDLSAVRRMDAHGLGTLLYIHELCQRHQCHLILHAPSPSVVAILRRSHLEACFTIEPPVASRRPDTRWTHRLDAWQTRFDQMLAAGALVLLAPLLAVIALAIKLDSPGPIFFRQPRMGAAKPTLPDGPIEGQIFSIIKFRTMVPDAEQRLAELMAHNQYDGGAFFKLRADPRISRVGRFLRRTSLDELPQLINVVKGQMRLVGNRPLPLYEAAQLREPWQRVRFLAPAGITGLWQISGRSDTDQTQRLVLDTYYSATRSLLGDWWILLKTVRVCLRQDGAH